MITNNHKRALLVVVTMTDDGGFWYASVLFCLWLLSLSLELERVAAAAFYSLSFILAISRILHGHYGLLSK